MVAIFGLQQKQKRNIALNTIRHNYYLEVSRNLRGRVEMGVYQRKFWFQFQWRIQGAQGMHAPLEQNFFIFIQFSEKIAQIVGWHPLGWRTPLGNPGFAFAVENRGHLCPIIGENILLSGCGFRVFCVLPIGVEPDSLPDLAPRERDQSVRTHQRLQSGAICEEQQRRREYQHPLIQLYTFHDSIACVWVDILIRNLSQFKTTCTFSSAKKYQELGFIWMFHNRLFIKMSPAWNTESKSFEWIVLWSNIVETS